LGGEVDDDNCPIEIPPFDCLKEEGGEEGTDVWHLRPQDINAVIALGDSISAGFGMISGRPPLAIILEYRGKAFSSGSDDGDYTLANFLRTYDDAGNPPTGAPSGVTLPLARRKDLNFAVSGSLSTELPSQASRLISALSHSRYDGLIGGYKLVTVLVGANNLCQACSSLAAERERADPAAFERDVRETLERLRIGVGRVFVNLVGLFNVSNVYSAAQTDPYCRFLFDKSNLALCPCATASDETRAYAGELAVEYNRRLVRIADDYGPGKRNDFGVVYQPGLEGLKPDEFGQGFLSRFDCFHPNRCAHRVMALGIWNNMFSPSDRKGHVGTGASFDNLDIVCPGRGVHLQ